MQANSADAKKNIQAAKPVKQDNNGEREIDLLELFYRLLDNWRPILIGGLICALLMGCWAFLLEPETFTATAKLYVINGGSSLVNLESLQLGNSLTTDYKEVFNNVEVHEQVRDALHLEYTDEELDKMITITNPTDTRILVITVKSKIEREALKMADAYAETARLFIEDRMDNSMPSVFERPTLREMPRRRALRTVIAFILGALAVAAYHTVRFINDDKITTSEFIEKHTGLPTLGVMPAIAALQEDSKKKSKKHQK